MRISDWSSDVCSSDLQTESVAIGTDHLHYQSDLFLNLSVIIALALDQYFGFSGADALFGIGITLWLAWNALRASSRAVDQLMDKEWPLERRQRFIETAGHHPRISGIHDLRTRTSGIDRKCTRLNSSHYCPSR